MFLLFLSSRCAGAAASSFLSDGRNSSSWTKQTWARGLISRTASAPPASSHPSVLLSVSLLLLLVISGFIEMSWNAQRNKINPVWKPSTSEGHRRVQKKYMWMYVCTHRHNNQTNWKWRVFKHYECFHFIFPQEYLFSIFNFFLLFEACYLWDMQELACRS